MDSSSHVISLLLANTLIKQLANLEILEEWGFNKLLERSMQRNTSSLRQSTVS